MSHKSSNTCQCGIAGCVNCKPDLSLKPETTNVFDVPEPAQLVALTEALRVCLPNLKLMPHAQLAATLERMLLKRGFRIGPESKEERDERQN